MKNGYNKPKSINVKLISTVALVVILFAVLAIVVFFNFDAIVDFLITSETPDGINVNNNGSIPVISNNGNSGVAEVFYVDPEYVTDSINIKNSYVRNIRITTTYENDETVVLYKLIKRNNLYKIESENQTVVFDGEQLYIASDAYTYKALSDGKDLYSEIGITPLDEVISLAEKYNAKFTVSLDKKTLIIEINDIGKSTRSLFEISTETGIVVSEAHYYKDTLYMKIITESIDVFGADNLPDDFFKVND